MPDFVDQDLSDARFRDVRLRGARFRSVDLSDVRVRGAWVTGLRLTDVEGEWVELSGEFGRVLVNGVDVAPYVEAELDRRDPDRVLMRVTTADGVRRAWDVVEERWAATVAHARSLPPERLHASVDEEWSFVQTLRHLVFATDVWVSRALLGDPAPWDPLDLPFDEMDPDPAIPWDRDARPDLDTVLALRGDRMGRVRRLVDAATDASLAGTVDPALGPPFDTGGHVFTVAECLGVVLNEEHLHRQYAERDLAILASPADGAPDRG